MAVYAVTRGKPHRQDITPAGKHGNIKVIYSTVRNAPWMLFLDNLPRELAHLYDELEGFDPEKDYFLPIGDQTQAVIAALVLSDITGGKVPMLVWDTHDVNYKALRVDLNAEEEDVHRGVDPSKAGDH